MDYAAVVDFARDNRDLIGLIVSLVGALTSVGVWRAGYNTFRVTRWGCRKVGGALTARREARERQESDRLAGLVHAALQRELDARTAPGPVYLDGQLVGGHCTGR